MNAKGFTLIETVVVLMLTGLLAAVAGVGIVTGARSFVDAREASELAQEAQLAMDRLTREIVELVDVPANSTSTLLVIRNVRKARRSSTGPSSTWPTRRPSALPTAPAALPTAIRLSTT